MEKQRLQFPLPWPSMTTPLPLSCINTYTALSLLGGSSPPQPASSCCGPVGLQNSNTSHGGCTHPDAHTPLTQSINLLHTVLALLEMVIWLPHSCTICCHTSAPPRWWWLCTSYVYCWVSPFPPALSPHPTPMRPWRGLPVCLYPRLD